MSTLNRTKHVTMLLTFFFGQNYAVNLDQRSECERARREQPIQRVGRGSE